MIAPRTDPLTLAECLAIPPLSAATVVAGQAGLGRPVRWVHVVDVPDIEECLVGGELVLTSGISLGHDEGLQRRIVPVMDAMALAGLVVAVGPYLDRVPPAIVAAADDHRIPVLELPWAVNFRDVTQAVLTAVVDRQHAMLQLSERIHRGLTQLVLHGGGLPDVTQRLAALLHRAALVLDPAFQVVAGEAVPDASEVVCTALATGRLAREVVARFRAATHAWDATRPVEPAIFGEPGFTGVLAPIVVERRLLGAVWIDGGGQQIGQLDIVAAEHGATVAALMVYKDEAVRRAERRHERDLLDRLLDGAAAGDDAPRHVTGARPLAGPLRVLAVAVGQLDPTLAEQVAETALARRAPGSRVRWRGGVLAIVVPESEADDLAQIVTGLREILAHDGTLPAIGVSGVVSSPLQIGAAFAEARDAVRLGPLVDAAATVHHADRMRTLRHLALAHTPGPPEASPVARLVAHDAAHGSDLVGTLDAWLQHDGQASAAARALGIHRHTLLYRLERIAAVTGSDLSPTARLDLRLALLLHRLAGGAA